MRLLTRNLPANCDVVLHGDTHEGNAMLARSSLESLIAWIKEKKNRYFIHMGDEIEATPTDHKYFDEDNADDPVALRQMLAVQRMYAPISGRCLAWMYGNHPMRMKRFGNITEELCRQLRVPYGGWQAALTINTNGRKAFKLHLVHGYMRRSSFSSNAKDYEQRKANMQAMLKRTFASKFGDCLVHAMGHTHHLMVVPPAKRLVITTTDEDIRQHYLEQGDGRARYIEPDQRWYVNTGTFVRGIGLGKDSYAEIAGYDPVEIGYALMHIRGGKLADIKKVEI